jgi:hypothetical protein
MSTQFTYNKGFGFGYRSIRCYLAANELDELDELAKPTEKKTKQYLVLKKNNLLSLHKIRVPLLVGL